MFGGNISKRIGESIVDEKYRIMASRKLYPTIQTREIPGLIATTGRAEEKNKRARSRYATW